MKVLRDLPPWGKRVISVVKVLGVVGAALFAFLAGAMDLYGKYDELKRKTESSYETLAPAIQELQKLFAEHVHDNELWVASADESIENLSSECAPLQLRVEALEQTIERLSQKHRGVRPIIPEESFAVDEDVDKGGAPLASQPEPAPRARKPARYVPDKIDQAADYQRQRQEAQCNPNNPLCGIR